ncbi:RPM1-interacting protein 4-like, partial [Trifolium medium]|nr:RPM1-interacting protein 4-like [Trifolium medium]
QRTHVPKFGNWESNDNVPYTAYFDKARKGRTGTKMINPNDPEENVDLVLDNSSSDLPPPSKPRANSEDLSGKGSVRPTIESHKSLEDGDRKNYVDSPARNDNVGNRAPGVGSADNRRRPSRQSTAGSEYSVERSPLHRQARAPAGKDSPSWEGGKNSYDSSHGTPGRSRLRPANRGDETPDKGAAVPKFGDWDVSNPASADGYTHIFNKVREERQGGAGHAPGTPNERPHVIRNQANSGKAQIYNFGDFRCTNAYRCTLCFSSVAALLGGENDLLESLNSVCE